MAQSIDQYIHSVKGLSQQGKFKECSEYVSKSHNLLFKNAGNLKSVLEKLDSQHHSIGFLKVLTIVYGGNAGVKNFEVFFKQVKDFILECNGAQVRFAADSLAELCHLLTKALISKKLPFKGIFLLRKAIDKIQVKLTQLTSIHTDLCLLCLVAKSMQPALKYLDADIDDVNTENGKYDSKCFLLYYYYGGMIYTALKQFDRALYFYESAITTPSHAVSHIVIEAYKKYILVSLIHHGKLCQLPKYTSQVVTRQIQPHCIQYHQLANSFQNNNPEALNTTAKRNAELYKKEKNMGLVNQCIASIYRKNIQNLTKTFKTLSLSDMANRVKLPGPKEAERCILNMIDDEEIFAVINKKDGMVKFLDGVKKFDSVSVIKEFDEEMKQCKALDSKLKIMTTELSSMQNKVDTSAASSSFVHRGMRGFQMMLGHRPHDEEDDSDDGRSGPFKQGKRPGKKIDKL